MKRAPIGLCIALLAGVSVGCAAPPSESERIAESIVITKHAPKAEFSQYKTYYLRPDVRTLDDDGELAPIDSDKAAPILNATDRNMKDRGFSAVAKEDADLGVELVYAESVTTSYWCYSWYDPYYWGYPAWGYYPYYGGCDATVWRSGMLATFLVDLTEARDNPDSGGGGAGGAGGDGGGLLRQVPGVWFSGVYAVSPTTTLAVDGINQAFKQSPYVAAGE